MKPTVTTANVAVAAELPPEPPLPLPDSVLATLSRALERQLALIGGGALPAVIDACATHALNYLTYHPVWELVVQTVFGAD